MVKIDIQNIEFKEKFIERYSKLTDFDEFKKYSLKFLRRSIRVNTLKSNVDSVKKKLEEKGWTLTPVPWCKQGFWVKSKRRDIGNLEEHTLGYFYTQDASSMIPPLVLNPKPNEKVLDMCASPGSKTTQIAMYMENKGLLIANDYTTARIKPLGMNLQRCGAINTMITLMAGQSFQRLGIEFDKILVDAPCSGTGTIAKSLKTLRIWNPNMVKRLSKTQKSLLEAGFKCLKKGGTLVYSTCTLEPEEDEAVVSYLLNNYPSARTEKISLPRLKSSEPVMEFEGEKFNEGVKNCLRIWPQDNDSEGFFVAKIKKE